MSKALGAITIPEEYIPQLLDLPDKVTVKSMHLDPLSRSLSIIVESPSPVAGVTFEDIYPGTFVPHAHTQYVTTTSTRIKVGD